MSDIRRLCVCPIILRVVTNDTDMRTLSKPVLQVRLEKHVEDYWELPRIALSSIGVPERNLRYFIGLKDYTRFKLRKTTFNIDIEEDNKIDTDLMYICMLNRDNNDLVENDTMGWFSVDIDQFSNLEVRNVMCSQKTMNYIKQAIVELRGTLISKLDLFALENTEFTISSLESIYNLINCSGISNFRRSILPLITETDNVVSGKGFRPAKLFKLKGVYNEK